MSHCTGLDRTLPPSRYSSSSENDSLITSMPEPRNFTVVFVVSILFKIRIRNCSRLRLWLHTTPGLNESDRRREIGVPVVVKYCFCTMSCEIFSRLRKSSENCCDVQKQRDGGGGGNNGGYRFSLHIRSPRFLAYRGGGVFWSKLWSSQIWSFSLGVGWGVVVVGRAVFRSKLWSSQIWSFSLGGGAL